MSEEEGALVTVGRVGRPHGLQGAFFVEGPSASPERFAVGASLLAAGERVRVVESKRARGRPVIRLDRRVERGAVLAVPRDELPPPAPDSYYVFQLEGLEVVEEETERALGRVRTVHAGVANDSLELESGELLPLIEECVRDVDVDARRILVARGFVEPR